MISSSMLTKFGATAFASGVAVLLLGLVRIPYPEVDKSLPLAGVIQFILNQSDWLDAIGGFLSVLGFIVCVATWLFIRFF